MAYRINGPTDIGDSASLNTIRGNVTLADITTTHGDLVYANGSNNLDRLAPGTAGQVLQTNGAGFAPSWITSSSSLTNGFSARKSGTQGGIVGVATVITSWSTATAPEYDTTAGAFNSVTGEFTAPSTGTYTLQSYIAFTNTTNAGDRVIQVRVNSTAEYQKTWQPTGSVSSVQNSSISTQLSLTLGDVVDITIFRSGGTATLTVSASPETWWTMTKLS